MQDGGSPLAGQLSRFRIEALHGRRTIDVSIAGNRLVLVGENGTGKSTVANFIYFFLTCQWNRLLDYKFKSITAVIDSIEIKVTRDELTMALQDPSGRSRRVPASIVRRIETLLRSRSLDELLNDHAELSRQSRILGIPRSIMEDYLLQLGNEDLSLFSYQLRETTQKVKGLMTAQVLFLPTYRRIEQDLASIFPGVDSEVRMVRERLTRRLEDSSFIELVEFGMEDVETTIRRKMNELKDDLRNDLNNLTGTYLRDVIRGDYRQTDPSLFDNLDSPTIDAIFSRIGEAILPAKEKDRLRDIIRKIKQENAIRNEEQVVAHFLTRLIELHKTQQENEKDVQEFVLVCNRYLSGKTMAYDNLNFDITIHQSVSIKKHDARNESTKITLRMLSSGEKQIVSLFSHIYLSGGVGYYVIIDEPELSLSVPWQKRFLPDILGTGRCQGLIAVTHSPFIFDNELDKYTHSLEEFGERLNVISR